MDSTGLGHAAVLFYRSCLRHIGMHPVVETKERKFLFFYFSLGCSVCWSLEQSKSGIGPENRHHSEFVCVLVLECSISLVVFLPVAALCTVAVKLVLLLLLLLQSLLCCCRGREGAVDRGIGKWEAGCEELRLGMRMELRNGRFVRSKIVILSLAIRTQMFCDGKRRRRRGTREGGVSIGVRWLC